MTDAERRQKMAELCKRIGKNAYMRHSFSPLTYKCQFCGEDMGRYGVRCTPLQCSDLREKLEGWAISNHHLLKRQDRWSTLDGRPMRRVAWHRHVSDMSLVYQVGADEDTVDELAVIAAVERCLEAQNAKPKDD